MRSHALISRLAASLLLGLAVCATASAATPQADQASESTKIAVAALDLSKPYAEPEAELSCPAQCKRQAEAALKTCLRTVARLKSDPNWMDDTLSADSCGKAAVAGDRQCRRRCEPERPPTPVAKPVTPRD